MSEEETPAAQNTCRSNSTSSRLRTLPSPASLYANGPFPLLSPSLSNQGRIKRARERQSHGSVRVEAHGARRHPAAAGAAAALFAGSQGGALPQRGGEGRGARGGGRRAGGRTRGAG